MITDEELNHTPPPYIPKFYDGCGSPVETIPTTFPLGDA